MTIVKKMSHEEIRQQSETISAIDGKVTVIDDKFTEFVKNVIKAGKILLPVFIAFCSFVVWIGFKAISLNDWNKSLVKQLQYTQDRQRQAKLDSIQDAKIDTLNKNKVNYTDIKKAKGKWAFVAERKDENGNIQTYPVN